MVHFVDKNNLWHRLLVLLGLFFLRVRRHLNQEYNLIKRRKTPTDVISNPEDYPFRTADGKSNDPFNEIADRHYPKMTDKWMNSSSAFSVWDSSPEPHNPIPLYFRIPRKDIKHRLIKMKETTEELLKAQNEWLEQQKEISNKQTDTNNNKKTKKPQSWQTRYQHKSTKMANGIQTDEKEENISILAFTFTVT
ncbi:hypothetical protein RND71_042467 [Anisodus tanguticus]|uniref:Uncharacterized protein n=1 Tax=Anisodus tanguticus TaxID=243964 RepID=A0AAE1QR04_9SOLA|nr:hypothetical protein RND71_042467 [Anisodus tanguticus]